MLTILFLILGILLFLLFLFWFYLVTKKFSKTTILLCDSLLIMLSVLVLIIGLQLRNQHLDQNRILREQELLQEIEKRGGQ